MKKIFGLLFLFVSASYAGSYEFWNAFGKPEEDRPEILMLVDEITWNGNSGSDADLPKKILRADLCKTLCCFGCTWHYDNATSIMEMIGKAMHGSEWRDFSPYAQIAARSYLSRNVLMLDNLPLYAHPESELLTDEYLKKHQLTFQRAPRPLRPWEKDCPDCRYPCPPACCSLFSVPTAAVCMLAGCMQKNPGLIVALGHCPPLLALWHITAEDILALRLKRYADVMSPNDVHEE